jgi:hypothetical protein
LNCFPLNFPPSFLSSGGSGESQEVTGGSGVGDRDRFPFLRNIEAACPGDANEGIFVVTEIEFLSRLGGDINASKDDGGGRP